ncbi:voltage-dependent potassium channel, beta subunit [Dimargaris cristalligena]|uniref:Voltage-dependent potassium channel, beta subunit n=1 Tax=Dimargaris cristalligena TaxID=215637 RepID=A0A4P9ZZJ0_9FUNG|nr:voltage-dependent potassium channel, beta subunit [Dimargaris cristalligena]|eukprot:RKP38531.1 voltage-dependent potassium channel, beta subunit [Dimargaris cristalligena]
MQYRYLGRSGLKVSAIGLGSWLTYGAQVSPEITLQCLSTARQLGINYFDTAEIYANGQCESVLGHAIKNLNWSRSDFVISTKIFWGGNGPNERGLSRKHIVEGLRGSLQRLQLEYVDIVIAHRPDPDTPMEEIVRAFDFVINRGHALYWGTSEWSSQQVTHAMLLADRLGLIRPVLEQPQYNMLNRDRVEAEYGPMCREFGLGLTTWSPLLSGVLTGKYLTGIHDGTRLSLPSHVIVNRIRHKLIATPEGQTTHDKVRRIVAIAEQIGCTPAQLAIAWCLRNRAVSSVLMGATNPQQIEENVGALQIAAGRMNGEWDAVLEEVLANKPEPRFNYRDA